MGNLDSYVFNSPTIFWLRPCRSDLRAFLRPISSVLCAFHSLGLSTHPPLPPIVFLLNIIYFVYFPFFVCLFYYSKLLTQNIWTGQHGPSWSFGLFIIHWNSVIRIIFSQKNHWMGSAASVVDMMIFSFLFSVHLLFHHYSTISLRTFGLKLSCLSLTFPPPPSASTPSPLPLTSIPTFSSDIGSPHSSGSPPRTSSSRRVGSFKDNFGFFFGFFVLQP